MNGKLGICDRCVGVTIDGVCWRCQDRHRKDLRWLAVVVAVLVIAEIVVIALA